MMDTTSLTKRYIVDFEGYKRSKNKFYIKEFTYLDLDTFDVVNKFVATPSSVKRHSDYNWVVANYHRIPYQHGTYDFYKVIRFLNQDAVFYVKGLEKTNYLRSLTSSIVLNLEDLGCPPYNALKGANGISCSFRQHVSCDHCAYKKALAFANWFIKNVSAY